MSNANKAKGTRWESAVRDYLRAFPGLGHVRRTPALGALDEGDLHMEPFGLQCKDAARFDLSGWLEATQAQADRAGLEFPVLVIKRRQKSVGEGYVVMKLSTFARLADLLRHLTTRDLPQ